MKLTSSLITIGVLLMPVTLAAKPGKCATGGGESGAGRCFAVDFNGTPTTTHTSCPVSGHFVSPFVIFPLFHTNKILTTQRD